MEDNSGAGKADKADGEGGLLIEISLEVNAACVNVHLLYKPPYCIAL